jgi:plasmid stability protein
VLALAFCSQQRHNAVMSVQITIRDVPDAVRDELASRAALQGKSMQEYLRAELERLAARPPVERVLERIRERKATAETRLSPEEILTLRDADRR